MNANSPGGRAVLLLLLIVIAQGLCSDAKAQELQTMMDFAQASILLDQGQHAEGIAIMERILEAIERQPAGADSAFVSDLASSLATAYRDTGQVQKGREVLERGLQVCRAQSAPDPTAISELEGMAEDLGGSPAAEPTDPPADPDAGRPPVREPTPPEKPRAFPGGAPEVPQPRPVLGEALDARAQFARLASIRPSPALAMPPFPQAKRGPYGEGPYREIVRLSDANWQQEALRFDDWIVVLFTASWNPNHARQMSEFEAAHRAYRGMLKFAVVEVGPSARQIVTEDWNGVQHPEIGVPTILWIRKARAEHSSSGMTARNTIIETSRQIRPPLPTDDDDWKGGGS